MRALTISSHGGLEQLELRDDLPIPSLRHPTDVRVRIRAAALNHLDLFVVEGLPGVTITPPWILGGDGTGTIDALGDAVTGLAVGDAVIINPGLSCRQCSYCRENDHPLCLKYGLLGEHFPGTLAEYIVVPAANLRVISPDTPVEKAAAFSLAMITAWRMIVSKAQVRPGEDVLIWGIGGGVALAALQIVKLRGARAWVTSSSDEKLDRARALGADVTLNHRTTDVAKEIRARTGKKGVDVVIDNVGAATWKQSLAALAKRGRLVTCGATSGPIVEMDVRRMFWYQWHLMGSTMGSDAEYDEVVHEFKAGALDPVVDSVYPLARAREAFERMAGAEQFGKIVIRIDD